MNRWLKILPRSLQRRHWLHRLRRARQGRDLANARRDQAKAELHQLMYANVGVTVVAWSELEKCLDAIIDMGHFAFGEKHLNPILPDSLDRELDYVKKLAKAWPLIRPLSGRLLLLCRDIHDQKEYRHNLIHGWVQFSDTEWFVSTLPRVNGARRETKRTVYSTEKMLKIAKRLVILLRDARALAEEIGTLFVEEFRDQYPKELRNAEGAPS